MMVRRLLPGATLRRADAATAAVAQARAGGAARFEAFRPNLSEYAKMVGYHHLGTPRAGR